MKTKSSYDMASDTSSFPSDKLGCRLSAPKKETNSGHRYIQFDIMRGDYFYRTIFYEFCPIFEVDVEEIKKKIVERLPTLKHEKRWTAHWVDVVDKPKGKGIVV